MLSSLLPWALAAHGGGVLPGHAIVKFISKTVGGGDAYASGGPVRDHRDDREGEPQCPCSTPATRSPG